MNNFERVAIFTVIENMETQLKGLKTLIAASANQEVSGGSHRVTSTIDPDSSELSDQDEDVLQKTLDSEIVKLRKSAEAQFQKEWETTAKTLSEFDG